MDENDDDETIEEKTFTAFNFPFHLLILPDNNTMPNKNLNHALIWRQEMTAVPIT